MIEKLDHFPYLVATDFSSPNGGHRIFTARWPKVSLTLSSLECTRCSLESQRGKTGKHVFIKQRASFQGKSRSAQMGYSRHERSSFIAARFDSRSAPYPTNSPYPNLLYPRLPHAYYRPWGNHSPTTTSIVRSFPLQQPHSTSVHPKDIRSPSTTSAPESVQPERPQRTSTRPKDIRLSSSTRASLNLRD